MIHQSLVVSGPMFFLLADLIWIAILVRFLLDREMRLREIFASILIVGVGDVMREISVLIIEATSPALSRSHDLRTVVGFAAFCIAIFTVFRSENARKILRRPTPPAVNIDDLVLRREGPCQL